MSPRKPVRSSRVPAGRLERLARFGLLAGELAAGSLAEGARRAFAGASEAGGVAGALLSVANAERLAKRLAQMRGAAMKLGQLLSLESADILPPELAEVLSVLRSTADTMPASQLRRVLGREYGKGWEARFASDWRSRKMRRSVSAPALMPPRTELGVPLPVPFPDATEDERYCLLVARWAYIALWNEPPRASAVVARLAAEVRAEAEANGSVRLPDPATLEPAERLLAESRAATGK